MRIFEHQFQDVSSSKEMHLSVHVSMNGFSFCVSNAFSGKLYYIAKYQYKDQVEQRIIDELKLLSEQIKELSIIECVVSIYSPRTFLLPFQLSDDIKITMALETLFTNPNKNDICFCDPMDNASRFIAWSTNSKLYHGIKNIFSDANIILSHASYLKKIAELYDPYILSNSLFLNIEDSYFTLTTTENREVNFFNIYQNEGIESILYHVLSAMQANKLNPEICEIIYSGCHDEKILHLLKKFISKVNPVEMFYVLEQLNNRIEKSFIQENFNILSLTKCE